MSHISSCNEGLRADCLIGKLQYSKRIERFYRLAGKRRNIIGICENIIKALGYTTFSDAFTFALLIVILLIKPTGLFGEKITDKV